ncbi:FGGY family carbohydrate kinase [Achromobacter sp. UMC71]|uniref:FGGY family carbohydrate kinase n=1 Tax=Achromobacter sp. UMC71 TaxID=1862320 RepID=UPI001603B560|nr:FGGY family carbohydrate kinase [Achromobacter sp. UMC71]MBB1627923.1 carbohydrate kinase [Achromobacter sp. UMC71]
MRTDIYLGIDMGSTGLKAVAFEAGSGATLAAAGGALPYRQLPQGGCELAADAIETGLAHALRGVAAQLGDRVREVRALSCTGHGAGLYLLDASGQLLGGGAVASTDQRAAGLARALGLRLGDALYDEVGCRPWSGQSSLIAAERFQADPALRGRARHLLFAKDYLAFLLTGQIATDASDASTAGLLTLKTGVWSAMAFEAAGLADLAAQAAPIVAAGSVIGRVSAGAAATFGLPAGVPVAMGAIDLLASLRAVGAERHGNAVAVLGTWCVNAVVAPAREPKPEVGAIVRFGDPDRRLYLENSPSSMANVAWAARALQFPDATAVVECAMSVPLGAEGLRFLPFINGGNWPAGASAGFVGLQGHHTRAHLARAVVDGVAAWHTWHLKRLAAQGLGVAGRVAALGGGARDRRMAQLLAGLLGHAVERCGDDETGARGAAGYAALSQGAGDCLPAPREQVEADPRQHAAHADFYTEFHALVDSMAPAFAQIAGAAR